MKTYTRDEVRQASLAFFSGDELATDVFIEKYALRNEDVYYESKPPETSARLAQELARAEAKFANPMSLREVFTSLMDIDESIPGIEELPCLIDAATGYGPIMPQGSPTAAVGNPFQIQSLSNCFVIESPYDSYGGICRMDEETAQIMKRRGGVGFDISTIRPKGQPTTNAARTTDGIGIFMKRYSDTTEEVAQNGRRGALMLTISINHPEVETFINIKRNKKNVTGANVSVKVTDEFMQAVQDDAEFVHRFPVDVPPEEAKITKVVRARDVWDQIIDAAWYSAEPGILFWDTARLLSPADAYASLGYTSLSTNPCGEIILSAYDSCRLQVIDVRRFVVNPWTEKAYFDHEAFDACTQKAMRLMDDLVELEIEAVDRILSKIDSDVEPEHIKLNERTLWERIRNSAINGRRTGLGPTAVGDAVAMLGVKYGSKESVDLVEQIYRTLALATYKASIDMAEERGSFPIWSWDVDKQHPFLQRIFSALPKEYATKWKKFGRRNIANTTTAPVGTGSIVLKSTSGIEPLFNVLPWRRRRKIDSNSSVKPDFVDDNGVAWQEYDVYHPGIQAWMDATGETDVAKSPYFGACAADFDWTMGVKIQAAAQKWVCHSISRTANLPKHATHDLISDVYMDAWRLGCKGFTAYRDGSRTGVLLTGAEALGWMDGIPSEELEKMIDVGERFKGSMPSEYLEFLEEASQELARRVEGGNRQPIEIFQAAKKRPKKLLCDIHRVRVMVNGESESYLALVGLMNGEPYEIFCGLSKHVDLPRKYTQGWIIKNGRKKGNIATYNLVIGEGDDAIVFKDIVEQFDNPNYGAFSRTLSLVLRHKIPIQFLTEQLQKDKHSDISSWSRAIARVIKGYIPDGTSTTLDKVCPQCGSEGLIYQSGCPSCKVCGFSKCL